MSPTQIVALVVAIAIIAVLVAVAVLVLRRQGLRQRFGPEYDRVVAEADSRGAAEAELRDRQRRHAQLQLTPLTPEATARYAQRWSDVQARFIEQPAQTVSEADQLVTELVAERGYPTDNYDEAIAHLSVEHGHTLGHYRDAHDISLANERGEATTEQLRQALMHYRAIFADILGEQPVPGTALDTPDGPAAVRTANHDTPVGAETPTGSAAHTAFDAPAPSDTPASSDARRG